MEFSKTCMALILRWYRRSVVSSNAKYLASSHFYRWTRSALILMTLVYKLCLPRVSIGKSTIAMNAAKKSPALA